MRAHLNLPALNLSWALKSRCLFAAINFVPRVTCAARTSRAELQTGRGMQHAQASTFGTCFVQSVLLTVTHGTQFKKQKQETTTTLTQNQWEYSKIKNIYF